MHLIEEKKKDFFYLKNKSQFII